MCWNPARSTIDSIDSPHLQVYKARRCEIGYEREGAGCCCRRGVVLGLSKVARLAKMFAKRFQEQQRFTCQMLEAFNAEVQPLGCAAIVEAWHLGTSSPAARITSASLGCFYAQPDLFMQVSICKFIPSSPLWSACNVCL